MIFELLKKKIIFIVKDFEIANITVPLMFLVLHFWFALFKFFMSALLLPHSPHRKNTHITTKYGDRRKPTHFTGVCILNNSAFIHINAKFNCEQQANGKRIIKG